MLLSISPKNEVDIRNVCVKKSTIPFSGRFLTNEIQFHTNEIQFHTSEIQFHTSEIQFHTNEIQFHN